MNKNTLLTYLNFIGLLILGLLWISTTTDIYSKIGTLNKATVSILNFIEKLNKDLLNVSFELKSHVRNLQDRILYLEESVKENITELKYDINYLEQKIEELKDDISTIYSTILWIGDWLNASYIDFETLVSKYPQISQCINGKIVNLPCIYYTLKEKYGFSYMSDNETFGKDILISPKHYIEAKSGDCEDISYFYTVLLTDLKKKDYNVYIMEYNPGSRMIVEYTSNGYVYYPNFRKVYLDLDDYYIYTLCFTIGPFEEGHCIIGFCRKPLTKLCNREIFNNCILVEPQSSFAKYKVIKTEDAFYIDNGIYNSKVQTFYIAINNTMICAKDADTQVCILSNKT